MNHDFINKCVELSELHILRFLKRNKDDCRDVAVRYDCKNISNNKKLLQPIDTWIRY
jgi:hypothetical protein